MKKIKNNLNTIFSIIFLGIIPIFLVCLCDIADKIKLVSIFLLIVINCYIFYLEKRTSITNDERNALEKFFIDKKKILAIGYFFLLVLSTMIVVNQKIEDFKIKHAKIEVILKDNLQIPFNSENKVSDNIESINGTIVDDYTIDTTNLGPKQINFSFINDDGIKVNYQYKIKVIDNTPPVIWLSSSYKVKKGSSLKFYEKILCGDDTDSQPNCYIEGNYDLNKVGDYPVKFKAIDKSGNVSERNFTLKVYNGKSTNETSSKSPKLSITDVIKRYKNDNTKIGIDVSLWQGDIDFKKVKEAGVEFVMIKMGSSKGTNGEYYLDKKFLQNIKGAQENNLPVGLYFYSYANSVEHAQKDALWLIDQIKDYHIDLPIAFDWEDWSKFNTYHISFYDLTSMSQTFIATLEKNGYKGMLYGSKAYLENIFLPNQQTKWLAHYTDQTDYQEPFFLWQMSNRGRVAGINGDVDIDIMYEKNS